MNKPMTDEQSVTAESVSVGETLRQRRLSNNWQTDEVADALNLSEDTVNALEADDYSQLPGSTFTRGYLRSYANLLGLDATELTQHVCVEAEPIGKIPTSRSVLKRKGKLQPRRKKRTSLFLAKWLVILFIVAALVSVFSGFLSNLDRNALADKLKMPFLKVEGSQHSVVETAKEKNSNILTLFGNAASEENPSNNQENQSNESNDTVNGIQLKFE